MNDKSYMKWYSMSDKAIAEAIGDFVRYNRLQKNMSQNEVSKQANISRSTLSLLERGEAVTVPTLLQVLRVLDLFHVLQAFEVEKQLSPIALAKLEREEKKRASAKRDKNKNESKDSDWIW